MNDIPVNRGGMPLNTPSRLIRTFGHTLICVALALSGMLLPIAAQAQEPAKHYEVPAGNLGTALSLFAAESGVVIYFDASLTQGKQTRGISGEYSVDGGLNQLLHGSGLSLAKEADGSYRVTARDESNATTLPPVQVRAEAARETATGPVDGYVATRGATSAKTDTPLIETPRSVTVVTADQIADRKAQSVEDALRYAAGVQVSAFGHDPRFDQITIRGVEITADADYKDGLLQPNTGWLSYFRTEPYGLERIEVVKGPNSVLFGQISPGGMVNRVSKRPTEETIREVEVQAGTDDHYQGQFDLAGMLGDSDTLTYRLVGLARESDTDITGVIDDNLYLAPSLTWRPTNDTSLTLLAHRQRYETAGSPRQFQLPSGELTEFWSGDEDFDRLLQTQSVIGYEFEHRFNDTFKARQNMRYGYVDTVNQYTSATLGDDGHTLDRTTWGVYEDMHNLAIDTALESYFSTGRLRHTLVTGIDYYQIDSQVKYRYGSAPSIDMWAPDHNQPISIPESPVSDLMTEAEQLGVYLQDQMSLNNWRLSFGLRHDRVERANKDFLAVTKTNDSEEKSTGSTGLLYKFDNGVSPYISYATSFIPQFSTDIFGNPYDPTEGEQWEIGVKYQPAGYNGFFTASLFDLKQKNVLTRDPANIDNQIQKGERQSRGLELEANMSLDNGLDLTATYTYQDVEISKSNDGDEGKKFVGIPEHMASIWGNYSLSDDWDFGLGARWVGESYSDSLNTDVNDAYTLVDARLAYSLDKLLPGATLAVNASNLTDKKYEMCHSDYCYRGLGRKIIISFNYNW